MPPSGFARTIVLASLVCAVGVVGGAARPRDFSVGGDRTQRSQESDAVLDAGRKVYDQQKCASCHQINRRGNSRFPLDGVGSKLTRDQLRRWMTDTAEMEAALPRLPAIRMSEMKFRLNARELDALVAYLASLK